MSRTGSGRRPGFVGGDIPMFMRLPKRGFFAPGHINYRLVNLWQLDNAFEAGTEVTPEAMMEKGLVSTLRPGVKVLGEGDLAKSLKVSAHAFSESAQEKIKAAGGTCTILGAGAGSKT
jgi:large subunit ribosomal protein L15